MSLRLQTKRILITGASSGIGEETAYQAATAGAHLVLSARRKDKLEKVADLCRQLGASSVTVQPVDIANPDSIDRLLAFLDEQALPIDTLINNAGFGHSEAFVEIDFDIIRDLFQVNVLGLMYLTQKIALRMLDQPQGHIINVASLAGKVSTPHYAAYGATKGAVISFSNALRMELKPSNIHVTTVNFGPVDTPFFNDLEQSRKEAADSSPFTLSGFEAGKIVAKTIGTKKREVNRPILLAIGAKLYEFFPALGDYIVVNHLNI